MKRALAAALTALLTLFTIVPAASAVSCTQLITFSDGSGGTNGQIVFCAEDYPLARTPVTSASFDQNYRFDTGVSIDNKISAYNWSDSSAPGQRVRLYKNYYFGGTGEYIEIVRPSGSTPWVTLPVANGNNASSFAGCGSTCSDEPT